MFKRRVLKHRGWKRNSWCTCERTCVFPGHQTFRICFDNWSLRVVLFLGDDFWPSDLLHTREKVFTILKTCWIHNEFFFTKSRDHEIGKRLRLFLIDTRSRNTFRIVYLPGMSFFYLIRHKVKSKRFYTHTLHKKALKFILRLIWVGRTAHS